MIPGIAIAIDGPAGSGKSTIAKVVAARFNYVYIDTGAMYRAITLKALRKQIPLSDVAQMAKMVEQTEIGLKYRYRAEGTNLQVLLDGEDVSEAIRSLEVTNNVSEVAAIGSVRAALVKLQQELAAGGAVVMDGRDIGTVVLPHAQLKVFLTASVAERSRRRWLELQSKGVEVPIAELEAQIERRDYLDSHREVNPLRQAEDALLLDTTELSAEQVIEAVVELAVARGAAPFGEVEQ